MVGQDLSKILNFLDQRQAKFDLTSVLIVTIIFLVITHIAVILRVWTRKKYGKLGWDDWLMISALVHFAVYCGAAIGMFALAQKTKGVLKTVQNTEQAARLLLVAECFYILTMIKLKLSIAVFCFRIMAAQWQRWIIVVAVSISTAFNVAYFFFAIFQCGYVENMKTFILREALGQCVSKTSGKAMNYTQAILGTVSNVVCGSVPIVALKNSNMRRKEKFIVGGLLVFASIGSIASIVRIVYIDTFTLPLNDFSQKISKLAVWSTVEPGIGITAASLATLRPLFQQIFKNNALFGRKSRRASSELRPVSVSTIVSPTQEQRKSVAQEHKRFDSDVSVMSDDEKSTTAIGKKSMSDEMRVYGMRDFDVCATVGEEDLGHVVDDEDNAVRRVSVFGDQRTVKSPRASVRYETSDRERHHQTGKGVGRETTSTNHGNNPSRSNV